MDKRGFNVVLNHFVISLVFLILILTMISVFAQENQTIQEIKCYQDSDCGQAAPSIAKYCSGSLACAPDTKYTCQNQGTANSSCVVGKSASCVPCQYGCQDGDCLPGTNQTYPCGQGTDWQPCPCVTSPQPKEGCTYSSAYGDNGCLLGYKTDCRTPTCKDTDGGLNYYEKGSLLFGEKIAAIDSCENEIVLREQSCVPNPGSNEGTMVTSSYKCPNGCQDGACIKGEKQREEVKCIFKNTQTEQKCYRAEYNWMYCSSYQGSCIVTNLEGYDGEKITWKSSCGGYAYTTLDGNNKQIEFDCSEVNGSFCQSKQCSDGSWTKCYVDGSGYCICTACPEIIAKPVCGNRVCESGEGEVCMITVSSCEAEKECKASSAQCKILCPEDCREISGIYAKLNEKFKLQVNQPVKITDYKNMKIIFKDLITTKCEAGVTNIKEVKAILTAYAVSETSTESVEIIKCPSVGPMAQLEIISPGEQGKKILTLKLNEAKNIYDVSVSFIEYDFPSRTGVFVVNSQTSTCPMNCICNSESYVIECRNETKCREKEILCPDGVCRKKCEEMPVENCEYGCLYNNKCLPIGVRVKGMYCNIGGVINNQLSADESCENNFECKTNLCIDGKCISSGLIKKIVAWFKKLFG